MISTLRNRHCNVIVIILQDVQAHAQVHTKLVIISTVLTRKIKLILLLA